MAGKKVESNHKALSLAGVASHTAPKGASGFFKWLWAHRRNKKAGDPSNELVYAEGVQIVRAFLAYAARHGVGELQRFTASHVPTCVFSSSFVFRRVPPDADRPAGARRAARPGSRSRRSPSRRPTLTARHTSSARRSPLTRAHRSSSAASSGGRSAGRRSPASGSRCACLCPVSRSLELDVLIWLVL